MNRGVWSYANFESAFRGCVCRWVLKAPLHLGFVATIQQVFPPGTRIVWAHRDPKSSIPSLCSLFQTMIEMHEVEKQRIMFCQLLF